MLNPYKIDNGEKQEDNFALEEVLWNETRGLFGKNGVFSVLKDGLF